MTAPLFERLGGMEAIMAVVDIRGALNNHRKWSALKGATATTRIQVGARRGRSRPAKRR